jgi:hypothetical protein
MKRGMRKSGLILFGTLSLTSSAAVSSDWTPDANLIAKLEAAVHIPSNDGHAPTPLVGYARYYAGKLIKGRRVIDGMLLLPDTASEKPGVYIRSSSKMPLGIMDGGCTEVTLRYDVTASRFLFTRCNGVA